MCDVRKSAVRMVLMGVAVGLLAGALAPAKPRRRRSESKRPMPATRPTPPVSRASTAPSRIPTRTVTRSSAAAVTLRFRSGDYTRRNNEISWATALNYYLNRKLAIVGDARGSFGDAHAHHQLQLSASTSLRSTSTPSWVAQLPLLCKGKDRRTACRVSAVLAGASSPAAAKMFPVLFSASGVTACVPPFQRVSTLDYNLYPNLAIRFSPTWVGTNFVGANGSTIQSNIGFNMGVVYRFGRQ